MVKKEKITRLPIFLFKQLERECMVEQRNKIHFFKLRFNCSNILNISALFYNAFRNELVTLIAQCENAPIEPKPSQAGKTFMLCI